MKRELRFACLLTGCLAASILAQVATPPAEAVRVSSVEPYFYCALEMKGSFDQHSTAFQKLYENAGAQGLPMNSASFGIYYNSPENTPVDSLVWELGLPLTESKTLTAPLVLKKWEYPLVATLLFEGEYGSKEENAAYAKLGAWIKANGYAAKGPMMEKFLGMPTQNEKGAWVGKVEIVMPVEEFQ